MPPNGDPKRASGEHVPSFVTYDHFNGFLEEFRRLSGDMSEGMQEIRENMVRGSARFDAQQREINEMRQKQSEIEDRQDDSSGKIRALQQDKELKEALAAQQAEQARPRRSILENVISTVVTAVILGALAVGYNAWRDAAIAEVLKEKEASHKTTPAPGPVGP